MTIRKSAIIPFDVNHLCPLMTHWSPSSTAVVDISTGSEPAWAGSVIENAERRLPSRGGLGQGSFCSGVPKWASTPELPESGARLPKTGGDQGDKASN